MDYAQRAATAMDDIAQRFSPDLIGWAVVDGASPQSTICTGGTLPVDGIVRISSVTKIIAAVASLAVVSDGLLTLDDPVERWVPAWGNRAVLRTPSSTLDDTIAASRSTTVRDLLAMGFGVGYSASAQEDAVLSAAHAADLMSHWLAPQLEPQVWAARVAQLPMSHQPGAGWLYQSSFDALTVVVEAATGQNFADVVADRVLRPLGMHDTGYALTPDQCERVVALRFPDDAGVPHEVCPAGDSALLARPVFCSAATGLVSTVHDLVGFAELLLAGGRGPNNQVLPAEFLALMATDVLEGRFTQMTTGFLPAGAGWGLGVGVRNDWFGWDGGTGTSLWVNPARQLGGVLLTTRGVGGPEPAEPLQAFWGALDFPG